MRNNLSLILCCLFFLMPLLFSCKGSTTNNSRIDNSKVIAKVGPYSLSNDQAVKNIPQSVLETDSIQAIKRFRDEWVKDKVLLLECERINLEADPAVKERVDKLREQALIEELISGLINSGDIGLVTNEDVEAYYGENKAKLKLSQKHVKLNHFWSSNYKKVEEARAKLLAGLSWSDIVNMYAEDSDKIHILNASQVYVPISNPLPETPDLERIVPLMGFNEVSPIKSIGERYHFVQLVDIKYPGTVPELDVVRAQIEDGLKTEKKRKILNKYLQSLYLKAENNNEIELFD